MPEAALITGTDPPTSISASSPLRATRVGAATSFARPSLLSAASRSWIWLGANPTMMLAADDGLVGAALGPPPMGPSPPAVVEAVAVAALDTLARPPSRLPADTVFPLM